MFSGTVLKGDVAMCEWGKNKEIVMTLDKDRVSVTPKSFQKFWRIQILIYFRQIDSATPMVNDDPSLNYL